MLRWVYRIAGVSRSNRTTCQIREYTKRVVGHCHTVLDQNRGFQRWVDLGKEIPKYRRVIVRLLVEVLD